MAVKLDQEVRDTPTGDLTPHPKNPNRGDVSKIRESIETNGWYGVIVAQRSTGYVLAGNHRLEAAKAAGLESVPVVWIEADDETATRILLADNRVAEFAERDTESLNRVLRELMEETGSLEGTGYDDDWLDDLSGATGDAPRAEMTYANELFDDAQYVVLTFSNSVDWQAARETLGIETVKGADWKPNYKREGIGRVIDGAEIVRRLNGGEG